MFKPLAIGSYRSIWLASLISNTGFLIQGVGSAWAMAAIAPADMVAMVQTATFLPIAVLAIPAGALADMYDRRKTQIAALCISVLGASALTVVAITDALSPWLILTFCLVVGIGVALFGPAWQSSVSEHVPQSMLPHAVALNGVSFNFARSVGPAAGGMIVATAGVTAAFVANALCYIPLIIALLCWQRRVEPSRLPPERLGWAMLSGIRYIIHMQPVRTAIVRSLVFSLLGAALVSLMPLIARDLIGGDAKTFGLMLGSFGVGAIAGALCLDYSRRFSNELIVRIASLSLATCVVTIALSRHLGLSCAMLFFAGLCWMLSLTALNVALQLFVPRWVTGRAVAALHANTAGGIAIGSWFWGIAAHHYGITHALFVAGTLLALSTFLGLILRVADRKSSAEDANRQLQDPDVALGINSRSGPIIVSVEYRISADKARDFYNLMQQVRRIRNRNGAYDWSLSRNISDPENWIERYRCPTWVDYLRLRARGTIEEHAIQVAAREMHIGIEPIKIRRLLERPFGSVRWKAESPDPGTEAAAGIAVAGGSAPVQNMGRVTADQIEESASGQQQNLSH